jgi:hypothetical protein
MNVQDLRPLDNRPGRVPLACNVEPTAVSLILDLWLWITYLEAGCCL